ncbi:hypothetical protein AAC387_Pa01g2219 [Persea americana]
MDLNPSHTLLPSRLSASEKNPKARTNFNLNLHHPLLARLERCTDMLQLRQIHAQIIATGLIHETFAASRLIAFCAFSIHGDLNYALALFKQIHTPNLFIWNAMIRAFSRSNHPEKSLQFYIDMLESGCSADSYTFPFLLKSCSHLAALSEGQQIHTHVVKTGLSADSFVANSLIHLYAECGCVEFAGLVYEKMPAGERNQVSWASMIAGFVDKDRPKEALALFLAEDWRKLDVDQITLATVLSACGREGDLDLGRKIHHYIIEEKIEMGLILCNSLMSMYLKCGYLETACGLFKDMPVKDSVSWNALISGFSENGRLEEGLELFREMKTSNVGVNEATFLSLISACDNLDLGLVIHNHVREMDLQWKLSICNALIAMYSRIGRMDIARKLFDEMPERDNISWNSIAAGYAESGLMESAHLLFDQMSEKDNFSLSTMILGYVRQGQSDEAMKIYKKLEVDGMQPDKVTIISVLSACSHLGALEEGTSIHQYLEKTEMQIDASLATALIDMYAKCGCLEKAMEIFGGLSEKDVCAWTALISGLAIHGHAEEALHVFRKMQHVGGESIRPNSITFLSILSACSHAGFVDEDFVHECDPPEFPRGSHISKTFIEGVADNPGESRSRML